jgi:hypothetical protein
MSERDAVYRGYTIRVERRGIYWDVSIFPMRPDLPILFWESRVQRLGHQVRAGERDHGYDDDERPRCPTIQAILLLGGEADVTDARSIVR